MEGLARLQLQAASHIETHDLADSAPWQVQVTNTFIGIKKIGAHSPRRSQSTPARSRLETASVIDAKHYNVETLASAAAGACENACIAPAAREFDTHRTTGTECMPGAPSADITDTSARTAAGLGQPKKYMRQSANVFY